MNVLIQSLEDLGAGRLSNAAHDLPAAQVVRAVMSAPSNLPCYVSVPPLANAAVGSLRNAA